MTKDERNIMIFDKLRQENTQLKAELLELRESGKQMQWVSVKDGLPDKNETVIVHTIEENVTCSYLREDIDVNEELQLECKLLWDFECDFKNILYPLEYVSHWMPLPPNPKEAE